MQRKLQTIIFLLLSLYGTSYACSPIISTKKLSVSNHLSNTYNPSIIDYEGKYLLVFRHDLDEVVCKTCRYRRPAIYCTFLDKAFNKISPCTRIAVPDNFYPEDARLHRWNGQLFLTYNSDVVHGHGRLLYRAVFRGRLDVATFSLQDITMLNVANSRINRVEKNWTPFESTTSKPGLYYIYSTIPHKIIMANNNPGCMIENMLLPQAIAWDETVYGQIRGGTPALLVDGQYLTFFHAQEYGCKRHVKRYVMGAYVFDSSYPFTIHAITDKPLLHADFYTSRKAFGHLNVIFPCGFVVEKSGEKTLLHVVCGENDTSIRVVSIDKDLLFASMKSTKYDCE